MNLGWSVIPGREKRELALHYRCPACLTAAQAPCTSLRRDCTRGSPIKGLHAARLVAAGFSAPERWTTPHPPGLWPSMEERHQELERVREQLTHTQGNW